MNTYRRYQNPRAIKLTVYLVQEIRRLYAQGELSQADLAEMFGLSRPFVSKLIRRETWAHID